MGRLPRRSSLVLLPQARIRTALPAMTNDPHLPPQGQLARLGHQGGGVDEADDHHRRGRARVGIAGLRVRRALLRDELLRWRGSRGASRPSSSRPSIELPGSAGVSDAIVPRRKTAHVPTANREVLRGIDAEVRRGETIASSARRAAGKSTFLRCLNGLTSFEAGTVSIAALADRSAVHRPNAPSLRMLRARGAWSSSGFHLFRTSPALENICLAPLHVRPRGGGRLRTLASDKALLARVGSRRARDGARPASLPAVSSSASPSRGDWRWSPEVLLPRRRRQAPSTRRCAARCWRCSAILATRRANTLLVAPT